MDGMNSQTEHKAAQALRRLFDAIGRCMTPSVARRLLHLRADPPLEARLQELADKCNEGELTREERAEYELYVQIIHFLTVLKSKARRLLKKKKVG